MSPSVRVWGYPVRRFPKPEAVCCAHSLLSQAKAEAFTTQLTNESKANLVSFVSHFQTLIKIICSDCLGKLFFALPFPSLYQYNFTGSRFPRGGSWQPWRGMWEGRRLTHTFAGSTARPLGSQQGGNPRPSAVPWTGSLRSIEFLVLKESSSLGSTLKRVNATGFLGMG